MAVRSACSSTWSSGLGSSGSSDCTTSTGTGVRPGIRVAARASAEDSSAEVARTRARPWVDNDPESRDADPLGLLGRRLDHRPPQRRGAPRPPPAQPREQGRVGGGLPRLERDQLVEQRAARLGREGALGVTGEGVDARTGVVATGHQHRRAGHEQPGLGEQRPPFRHRARAPGVVGGCRAPDLVDLTVGSEKACGVSDLDDKGGPLLVDVEGCGGAGEVAHGQPAAAQHHRRSERPRLEQVLDQPGEGERLLARCAVDELRGAVGVRDLRGRGHHVAHEGALAQHQRDLARQHHGLRAGGLEQVVCEQPFERVPRGRDVDRALGALDATDGRSPHEPVERLSCTVRSVGQDPLDQRGVGGVGRDPATRLGHRGTEAGGVGSQRLTDRSHEVQVVVVAPHQGQGAQPIDDRP